MRKVLLFLIVVAALAVIWAGASFYSYQRPLRYTEQTIIIPPHTGERAALTILRTAGLIPPLPVIALPLILSGHGKNLKAGEYFFEAGLSPVVIIGRIARGEIVVHKVTIPEGWNRYQVAAALVNEPLLTGELPPIAEGSVWPDTMRFTRGEARSAVLARMQQARDAALAGLWADRVASTLITTPEQALILASVVERETGVTQERPLVAGVFLNRLRLGMPLQSDPTVAYGIITAHGGAAMTHALTLADLKADTPYNSYTRTGLPPTPICNPGRAAILAVLHPAQTDALYFVATGHGGHAFAATLEEHSQNVIRYRQELRAGGK